MVAAQGLPPQLGTSLFRFKVNSSYLQIGPVFHFILVVLSLFSSEVVVDVVISSILRYFHFFVFWT